MDKQLLPKHWTIRADGSAVTQRGTELPAPAAVVKIYHKGSANELLTHYIWVMEIEGKGTVTCRYDDKTSNRNSFRAYKRSRPADLDLHRLARAHTIDPVGSKVVSDERFGQPLTWGAIPMPARRPTIKVTLTGSQVIETWLLEPVEHHREEATEHLAFGGSRYDGYRDRSSREELSLEDPFRAVDPYSVPLGEHTMRVVIDSAWRHVEFLVPGLEDNRPDYRFYRKGPLTIQGAPVSLRNQAEWILVSDLLARIGVRP